MKTPKPISFDDDGAANPVPSSHVPLPVSFATEGPVVSPMGISHKNPRAISFEGFTESPAPPVVPIKKTSSINTTSSTADRLVQIALEQDETLKSKAMRLKPRFDALLQMKSDDILNWGDKNAETLRMVTAYHKDIAVRIQGLEVDVWVKKITDASSKLPSIWGKMFGESPIEAEAKIQEIRKALFEIIYNHTELHDEISPRSEDLRMDIVALTVLAAEAKELFDVSIVQTRIRTLIAVQQTTQMATISLENSKTACLTHIEAVDRLLQVTIPNWKIEQSQKH